ncbi:MAG TPA: hypothetical protein VHM31_15155 [Polyangia bacterium]|nr:hypothetical protein [Polyangia bacterium]
MSPLPHRRSTDWVVILGGVALAAVALTCATTRNPNAAKYPPRGRGCSVRIFNGPAPDVKEWDDLGIARVDCPLDLGRLQCRQRLREEACRMGGDLLYDVPKKPARPSEQGMVYMGHVAHTKAGDAGVEEAAPDADEEPAGQPGFDRTAPIEPLAPAAPAPPADAAARD